MDFQKIICQLRSKLKEAIVPNEVVAIYIYGSALRGKLRTDSDVDIAMLVSYEVDSFKKLELTAKVEGVFKSLLEQHNIQQEISVLDMRGKYVSFQLLYKVITEGILLYTNDDTQRLEFENAIKREYFDFRPYLAYIRGRKYGNILQKT